MMMIGVRRPPCLLCPRFRREYRHIYPGKRTPMVVAKASRSVLQRRVPRCPSAPSMLDAVMAEEARHRLHTLLVRSLLDLPLVPRHSIGPPPPVLLLLPPRRNSNSNHLVHSHRTLPPSSGPRRCCRLSQRQLAHGDWSWQLVRFDLPPSPVLRLAEVAPEVGSSRICLFAVC